MAVDAADAGRGIGWRNRLCGRTHPAVPTDWPHNGARNPPPGAAHHIGPRRTNPNRAASQLPPCQGPGAAQSIGQDMVQGMDHAMDHDMEQGH